MIIEIRRYLETGFCFLISNTVLHDKKDGYPMVVIHLSYIAELLADLGLLSPEYAEKVADHILQVYSKVNLSHGVIINIYVKYTESQ